MVGKHLNAPDIQTGAGKQTDKAVFSPCGCRVVEGKMGNRPRDCRHRALLLQNQRQSGNSEARFTLPLGTR